MAQSDIRKLVTPAATRSDASPRCKMPKLSVATKITLLLESAEDFNPYTQDLSEAELVSEVDELKGTLRKIAETAKLLDRPCFDATRERREAVKRRHGDLVRVLNERRKLSDEIRIRERYQCRGISEKDIAMVDAFQRNSKFGPRSGMRPSERYHRAVRFKLNPPTDVLNILERWPEKMDAIVQL
ncbi:hypothetical protein CYMTET_35654 [Cymbomonas tetramitiformis]|uniref:Uncharacterized protein n=1 Tax=Cymbomonas tetramitiformis TaxID=36881 RepID=A0AAE0KNL7_9CHLO|nr:hypothetical protein CYMTET_35654 [Cymbomonas tetramitiformis]|eukprot:gene57-81_t